MKIFGVGLIFAVGAFGVSTPTAAGFGAAKPVVVHRQFHLVGDFAMVQTNGRFVMLFQADQTADVMLIDEHTGKSVELPYWERLLTPTVAYGAMPPGPAGSPAQLEEYELASGLQRMITVNDSRCDVDSIYDCTLYPDGTRWLGINPCYAPCPSNPTVYQSQATGRIRNEPPTSATSVLDADSPTLVKTLCWPLRSTWESPLLVDDYGRFTAGGAPLGNFALGYDARGRQILEKCGSHARQHLPWYVDAANSRAVIAFPRARELVGMFLTTRRLFTIPLPAALHSHWEQNQQVSGIGIDLSDRTLFVGTWQSGSSRPAQLWETKAP